MNEYPLSEEWLEEQREDNSDYVVYQSNYIT